MTLKKHDWVEFTPQTRRDRPVSQFGRHASPRSRILVAHHVDENRVILRLLASDPPNVMFNGSLALYRTCVERGEFTPIPSGATQ